MKLNAIRAETRLVVRTWLRDTGMVTLTMVIPIVLLLSLGFMFSNAAPPPAPLLLVADQDHSEASGNLTAALAASGLVSLEAVELPAGLKAADAFAGAAGASGLLVLPPGFAAALLPNGSATVDLALAGGEDVGGRIVRAAVDQAVAALLQGGRHEEEAPRLAVSESIVDVQSSIPYSTFVLPGIVGMNALTLGLALSFGSIAHLRQSGLLDRLALSPMTKREWLLGRMLGVTTIMMGVTALLILVGVLVFRADVHITPWTVLLVIGGTLVFSAMGAWLGVAAKDLQMGGAVMNLAIFPIVLFSGSFFSLGGLPSWLQWIPKLSPLHYLNEGLRADMLAGDAMEAIRYAAALFVFAALVLLFAVKGMRWSSKD